MSGTWHLDEVPMFELYRNINMSPNPFIIDTRGDDDDSEDDSVFKFPPPKKYTRNGSLSLSPSYQYHRYLLSSDLLPTTQEEMADDPGHKAMLFFLEKLMNSGVPLTISQLAGRFGSKSFTPEMRQACGGNESGLRKFLLKFPSLFFVNGNLVTLNDGTAGGTGGGLGKGFRESSPASTTSDVSVETEAVQYFRAKMIKKEEKWVHILSLAGHLSQASPEIRECVGPQTQFKEWLERHPLIFEIRGEMVTLKDNINYSAVNPNSESLELDNLPINPLRNRYSTGDFNPYISGDQGLPRTPKTKRRPKSIELPPQSPKLSIPRTASFNSQIPVSAKAGPATMTANEYKAVMFLKAILEKKGDMKLNGLTGHFSQAPESLRNTVGWSKPELEKFVRSHANIFVILEDEMVSVIKNARLNVIITGSRPPSSPRPAGKVGKGRVYHVAKLWGIIDLGRHEHVFIDRTIFGKHIDDLNKLLTVGEMVCFDSIPAPKGSRARWRAIKIWKEHESIEDLVDKVTTRLSRPLGESYGDQYGEPLTPSTPMPIANIDEEIRRMIPELNDYSVIQSPLHIGGVRYSFPDAAPSGAGVVPVWNFRHQELSAMTDLDDLDLSDDGDSPNLTMVSEKFYMNRSVLGDSIKRKDSETKQGESKNAPESKTATVGCQTIVTGEVLATQLFHED